MGKDPYQCLSGDEVQSLLKTCRRSHELRRKTTSTYLLRRSVLLSYHKPRARGDPFPGNGVVELLPTFSPLFSLYSPPGATFFGRSVSFVEWLSGQMRTLSFCLSEDEERKLGPWLLVRSVENKRNGPGESNWARWNRLWPYLVSRGSLVGGPVVTCSDVRAVWHVSLLLLIFLYLCWSGSFVLYIPAFLLTLPV